MTISFTKNDFRKSKKDSQTLFIQIGSIDELDQINKKEFYQTPYAFSKITLVIIY